MILNAATLTTTTHLKDNLEFPIMLRERATPQTQYNIVQLLIKINLLLRVGSSWEARKKSGTGRGVLSWGTNSWNRTGSSARLFVQHLNFEIQVALHPALFAPACGREVKYFCFDGKEQPPPWWKETLYFSREELHLVCIRRCSIQVTSTLDAVVAAAADHCCVVCCTAVQMLYRSVQ